MLGTHMYFRCHYQGKKLPINIEEMGDMDEDSNSYCVSDEDESEDAFEVVCIFCLYFTLTFYFILL